MTFTRSLAMALAASLVLVACGDESTLDDVATTEDPEVAAFSEECGRAVEEAATVGDMEDTVEALDSALVACDLEELRAAVAEFPDALDGTDLEIFVRDRCLASEDEAVTGSLICDQVTDAA